MKNIVPFIAVIFVGCSELSSDYSVTSNYPTLAAAREDHLFERGWLPELLPSSSRNIHTSNNLDLNTSSGEFFMAPADVAVFISSVSTTTTHMAVQSNELTATYTNGGYVWQFSCNKKEGHCAYQMQPVRA